MLLLLKVLFTEFIAEMGDKANTPYTIDTIIWYSVSGQPLLCGKTHKGKDEAHRPGRILEGASNPNAKKLPRIYQNIANSKKH